MTKYTGILFVENDTNYSIRDSNFKALENAWGDIAFDKNSVHPDFIHLIGAAAGMYMELNMIHGKLESVIDILQRLHAPTPLELELVTFMQHLRGNCENMVRLADVGSRQFIKELAADQKSKIKS